MIVIRIKIFVIRHNGSETAAEGAAVAAGDTRAACRDETEEV